MWTIYLTLFESETKVDLFKNFTKTCHPKMKFTFEKEQSKCFNFLNIKEKKNQRK